MPKIEKEITPAHLRCSYGGCPSVSVLTDGSLLIVGKKPSSDLMNELNGKVADDEQAVTISAEFLRHVSDGAD